MISLQHIIIVFSFIIVKNNYPQIHKYFPDGPPTSLKFRIMRPYILIEGECYYMSLDIEDYFASGKNYEHTEGSVHQTKLEILITMKKWWDQYCKKHDNNVCTQNIRNYNFSYFI